MYILITPNSLEIKYNVLPNTRRLGLNAWRAEVARADVVSSQSSCMDHVQDSRYGMWTPIIDSPIKG